jgi:hypothetical protein
MAEWNLLGGTKCDQRQGNGLRGRPRFTTEGIFRDKESEVTNVRA